MKYTIDCSEKFIKEKINSGVKNLTRVSNLGKKMNKYLRILIRIFKCSLMRAMEYRLNFFFGGIFELSWMMMYVLLFNVIFLKTNAIAGWTKDEIIMLVVLTSLFDAILTFLFNDGFGEIPGHVNQGTLDFILLKPINKQFYLSFRRFNIPQIFNIFIMTSIILYLIISSGIEITLYKILMFSLLVINGIFIMYSICFLVMIASFWVIKVDVCLPMLQQIFSIGNKPIDVYPRMIQKFFVYFIPVFVAYSYPIKFIKMGLQLHQVAFSFVISIVFFVIIRIVFRKGLNRYTSASS